MADVKVTRKDLFARIAETMADDREVVEMCEKYIEQLSKPRKKKVNEVFIALTNQVAEMMAAGTEYTNKELVEKYNTEVADEGEAVSSQKMAAVMRHLVGEGKVEKIAPEKASDPARYTLA